MSLKAFEEFENSKKPEISMAPLIDMIFLLLIFFVVTTTFTKETGIKVDKAKAVTSQPLQKNLFIISIDKKGKYWYDKKSRALENIVDIAIKKSQKNDKLNIVIVPDKNGLVEPLINILDKLRQNNLDKFSIGTQLTDKK